MPILVGSSGYSYQAWKGSFYPADLQVKSMLRFYSEQFPTVEINATFRTVPKPSVVENWARQVPASFRFALKAPFQITHQKRLRAAGRTVSTFVKSMTLLGRHQGPVLFQLAPNFKKHVQRLRAFLRLLPVGIRAAFEFRNASWFDEEIFALLRQHLAALCIAETDEFQVPFVATANWGYLRLRRRDYSRAQLKAWAKRIHAQKWRNAYVYFRHEDEAKAPRFAHVLMECLSACS
jgi:uncharacterized protein YecE (DUF72 family)